MLLLRHTEKDSKKCHVYVSTDLKLFIYKDPKKRNMDDSMQMKAYSLRSIEKGRTVPALQKRKKYRLRGRSSETAKAHRG
eukprot:TRINITY_DN3508_c0_g1_i1.p2 TRINITY_DN3508_c0_g1~~TRINITY_DN3508_c0_g1_i1.p2  ORF type:complete len:80 (-),score=28.08 TRINITY_DN3508_c0_g1_i1:2-241(-)